MSAWRRKIKGGLPLTPHGRLEVVNSISLAVFRGERTLDEANEAWKWIEDDFADEKLHTADVLWRAALNRALEISKEHTPRLGARSLDVLHVACALELKLRYFLTFDARQAELAAAVGLKLVRIGE
jgi:predicted nucleic acid-binding protein